MFLLDNEKIWLNGLFFRLISRYLPDYLIFLLEFCLEGRTSTAHLNGSTSASKPTPSSLPQGAVLSTTLFSLYLSHMPHPSHIHLALCAEDTALLSQSWRPDTVSCRIRHAVTTSLNPLAPELFFLILAHPVYKMWIIQEPNKLALWNKLHFEEKKNGEYRACLKYSVTIFVE